MKITKKDNIFYGLSMITLMVVWAIFGVLLFFALWPFEVVKLNKDPLHVLTPEVHAGERVRIALDYEKKINIPPEFVNYNLLCELSFPLTAGSVSRPTGRNQIQVEKIVPHETPPGPCRIQVRFKYKITFFRDIDYVWETETFKVLPPKGS